MFDLFDVYDISKKRCVGHDKIFSSVLTNSTHIYGMQHNLRIFQKNIFIYKHQEKNDQLAWFRKEIRILIKNSVQFTNS